MSPGERDREEEVGVDHIAEAKRLLQRANSDPDMGRIERAMYIGESNNHLLWALLARTGPVGVA